MVVFCVRGCVACRCMQPLGVEDLQSNKASWKPGLLRQGVRIRSTEQQRLEKPRLNVYTLSFSLCLFTLFFVMRSMNTVFYHVSPHYCPFFSKKTPTRDTFVVLKIPNHVSMIASITTSYIVPVRKVITDRNRH